MKKRITLLLISILTVTVCFAQANNDDWRKKYLNLGFIETKMSLEKMPELKSNYGASLTVGRTFYLHKPIGGFLRFGIDATWLDLNYTNYQIKRITDWEEESYQYHQGEISMHIGPSITIKPGKWNIHGYFRFAPSFSALYTDDTLYSNYATFFVGGASISYKAIGLGIEKRYGKSEYKEFSLDFEDEEESSELPVCKTKYDGWKAYLTFRF